MKKIYEKHYVQKIKEISEKYKYDEEVCHSRADDLLVEFIREVGLDEFADEYEKLTKWYA